MEKYPYQFYIFGKTLQGNKFRPSDWAERFCGVLSQYQPKNLKKNNNRQIGYSPYAQPQNYKGEKVVLVNKDIEKIEPLAWKFVISFVDDNKLAFEEKLSNDQNQEIQKKIIKKQRKSSAEEKLKKLETI